MNPYTELAILVFKKTLKAQKNVADLERTLQAVLTKVPPEELESYNTSTLAIKEKLGEP